MRGIPLVALVLGVSVLALAAQTPKPAPSDQKPASTEQKPTPAQEKIDWAERTIQAAPGKFQGYNELALGLVRRVRETSKLADYALAEDAVKKSLSLAPGNFEALKIRVTILLGRKEFAQALEKARALNHRSPDDVSVWGYIAEAAAGLGVYEEAEKAAQWMLDLRPGNVPGLIEGAVLRKLYGDLDGALDFLKEAYQQAPPNEGEESAWLLTEMAEAQLEGGRVEIADKLLAQALGDFPGYYRALEGLARVRTARRQYAEAVDLLRQRNKSFPTLESQYALAEALERAGQKDQAAAVYNDFEDQARRRIESADNANRELVFYYADHAHSPAEALRIARLEAARRHDVFTLDAYAWALYVNANYGEAQIQMDKALTVGIRDGEFFYHAGRIASKLGKRAQAEQYFKQARDLGWLSEQSGGVQETRDGLVKFSAVASPITRRSTAQAISGRRRSSQ